MATQKPTQKESEEIQERQLPEVTAVPAEIALVSYRDEFNRIVSQFALIGPNSVHLLDGKQLGLSGTHQRTGRVVDSVRDAIFKKLGRDIPPPTVQPTMKMQGV